MFTYVILFGLIGLLGYFIQQLSKGRSKNFRFLLLFIIIAVLVLLAGFRGVGADFGNYTRLYGNLKRQTWETMWKSMITFDEPGYKLLCLISSWIHDSPTTMFFLSSLLTITPCVILIYKEKDPFTFAIILYFLLVWTGTFGAVRQYLAAAMIFCAYPYLRERKFWKYCFFVILGATFHITALIMIPVYFLVVRKASWKNTLILVVFSFILRYSYDIIFSIIGAVKDKEFGEYSYLTTEVNIFRILVAFAPIVLFIFITKSDQNISESQPGTLALSKNLILINAAFMFATMNSAYLARVGIYTSIFSPLIIPDITKTFERKTRIIVEVVIVLCYAAYFLYGVYAQDLEYIFVFQR